MCSTCRFKRCARGTAAADRHLRMSLSVPARRSPRINAKTNCFPSTNSATEFGIHQRTLRDAVRAGRLEVHLSTRSAFGRPIRRATRAAVFAYQQRFYRRSYSRTMRKPPIPQGVALPVDYAERVILTRHALRLTLSEFAGPIGAANKAVVCEWESGKRRPSPVFWARIVALRRGR